MKLLSGFFFICSSPHFNQSQAIIFPHQTCLFASPVSLLLRLLCLPLKNRLDHSRTEAHRTSAVGRDEYCCSCCCSPAHPRTCTYHLSVIIKSVKIIILYMLCGALIMLYVEKFISFNIPMAAITQSDYKKLWERNKSDVRFLFLEACVLRAPLTLFRMWKLREKVIHLSDIMETRRNERRSNTDLICRAGLVQVECLSISVDDKGKHNFD